MDFAPASRQAQAHRIAILHEGPNLSIPEVAPLDLQHPEEGMEGREVGERKCKLDDPPLSPPGIEAGDAKLQGATGAPAAGRGASSTG